MRPSVTRARRIPSATPPGISVIAATGIAVFILLPLIALAQRAPWSSMIDQFRSPAVGDAIRLSLICSTAAAMFAALIGLPLAWVLARGRFRGRTLLRGLITLPMVLPPVVGGVALLLAFGRRGLAGQWLDRAFGIHLPFTTGAAILAETFVALPFLVLTVEGALRSVDARHEEAAATLGASRWAIMRTVTAPLIAPSLVAGVALAWARALGEFGATITFAGSLQGRTQTLPLAVYAALESDPQAAIALSLLMVALSITVLVIAGRSAINAMPQRSTM